MYYGLNCVNHNEYGSMFFLNDKLHIHVNTKVKKPEGVPKGI